MLGHTYQAGCRDLTAGNPFGADQEVVLLLAHSQLGRQTRNSVLSRQGASTILLNPFLLELTAPRLPLVNPPPQRDESFFKL